MRSKATAFIHAEESHELPVESLAVLGGRVQADESHVTVVAELDAEQAVATANAIDGPVSVATVELIVDGEAASASQFQLRDERPVHRDAVSQELVAGDSVIVLVLTHHGGSLTEEYVTAVRENDPSDGLRWFIRERYDE